MPTDLTDKTVLWVDNGLFVSFAQRCSEFFGKTLYYTPWVNGFPKSNAKLPGVGLEGLQRVDYPWDYVDKVDLWVFADVYYSDWQKTLVGMGKRVWGARAGETLELDRWKTKERLKELGMPVGDCALIQGLDNLRDYLKDHEDVFVKVSVTRGDMETWHSETYELSEPRLDLLEHDLGGKKNHIQFVVEDALNDRVEIGYDGWCVDGKFPEVACYGIERKDAAYIGVVEPYDELPESIRWVNDKLSGFLAEVQYRNFFSTEIRIGQDREPYLTDPCCRCGSPPSEVYQELFDNWGEILWHGADGELVVPSVVARYGVEGMLHSSWADKNWQALHLQDDVRQWVKLRNHCRFDGVDYAVPQAVGLPEIGAVVGIGNTLDEAIAHMERNAEQVHGYYLESKCGEVDAALEEIKKGEAFGIHFPMD